MIFNIYIFLFYGLCVQAQVDTRLSVPNPSLMTWFTALPTIDTQLELAGASEVPSTITL